MRRPLISTSVRIEVSPRSEMPDKPPVVAPEADELTVAPELVIALTVCSNCSTLTAPGGRDLLACQHLDRQRGLGVGALDRRTR